ncbi:MAG: glycosyltransferase [Frankiales bacterium]|nr:glycosyltransferase [Frankiales bacterium]
MASADGSRVSVIMPVRQEGAGLPDVLAAVTSQDCVLLDRIVVALGPSEDGTAELVDEWARRDARVLVLPNPEGIVSTGLNRAVQAVNSRYVVRIDGHCLVPRDYVSCLLSSAARTGAACVGPRLRTIGATTTQRAIAAAMSSGFGVGGSRFRTSSRSGYVDTVAFGLYERDRLLQLGGFRPELVRNQDDELNARLRRAGGTVYLDADVCVDYYPRGSLRGLWRQYFEYGYWRTITARAFGDQLRIRQLVPGLFVVGLTASIVLAALGRPLLLAAGLSAYSLVLGLLILQTARRTSDVRVALLSAPAAVVLHLSYGCGLWRSLLRPNVLRPGRLREELAST